MMTEPKLEYITHSQLYCDLFFTTKSPLQQNS